MENKIVSVKNGRVVIRRCVLARGYHLWIDCNLKTQQRGNGAHGFCFEAYMEEQANALNSLQHTGYYRVEESIEGHHKYYLRLVPTTKSTMIEYLNRFDDRCEAQMELESDLDLIQDIQVRYAAQDILYDILAEVAENSCKN